MAAQIGDKGLTASRAYVQTRPTANEVGDFIMNLSTRPVLGFGAAFTSMALVAIAGVTAPCIKTTLHASAGCPDKAAQPAPATSLVEAERPA